MISRRHPRALAALFVASGLVATACAEGSDTSLPVLAPGEDGIDEPVASDRLIIADRDGRKDPGPAPAPAPAPGSGAELPVDASIRVDQFGYLPGMDKVAVIVADSIGTRFEVRSNAGDVAMTGAPRQWNGGALHAQSGDRGSLFDFSSVTAPGTYRVVDVDRGVSSGPFRIGADVYDDVLDAAMKAFWYNRGNFAHPAALAGPWAQPATIVSPGQDLDARSVDDRSNSSSARDLSGGWYDAGDTNKYVTFAADPVHQLLGAYEAYPSVFDDASGITESGNGIPDILDEVRYELAWLKRMQNSDGSVLIKVGFTDFSDADSIVDDTRPRYYEQACTSATIAAAGMYAHGARVFESIDAAFAADLRVRAENAWNNYQATPQQTDCDDQTVKAGDADRKPAEQDQLELTAAIHLYGLTGASGYQDFVKNNIGASTLLSQFNFGRYSPHSADALAAYLKFPNTDAATVNTINERLRQVANSTEVHGFDESLNLYRSHMPDAQYHWGSNRVMANTGGANFQLIRTGAVAGRNGEFRQRGDAHLNTLHGVNPLGIVYLSNMGGLGAERSLNELYHFWFADGSIYDNAETSAVGPAPGYVSGGPNKNYQGSVQPPLPVNLPSKAYRDWNSFDNDGQDPWAITEPAIYYQSAYVALLAAVIANG